MRPGTRTLLFGVHQVVIHPCFVFAAWWWLYGFPHDPRLWSAFVVHDRGYWDQPNLDGSGGKRHPELGGRIMARLFGQRWGDFIRLHSRHYARIEGLEISPLCIADKMAIYLMSPWMYLPLARMSGELWEYINLCNTSGFYEGQDPEEWNRRVREHFRQWVEGLEAGA